MDVNTGEVLGMAVKGDFDPNEPFKITDPSEEEKSILCPKKKNQKPEMKHSVASGETKPSVILTIPVLCSK